MSLALSTQLKITNEFQAHKEIMMKEAAYHFPNETPDTAYNMLLRKTIDDEIKETIAKLTMQIVAVS